MDLRELRKEVLSLPDSRSSVHQLHEQWLKPLARKPSFLKNMDGAIKKGFYQKRARAEQLLHSLESSSVREKLRSHAHSLINMKLALIRGDTKTSQLLAKKMIKDDFLNIRKTIAEIRQYDEEVQALYTVYQYLNEVIQTHSSLEETILHLHVPHKMPMQTLLRLAQQHKTIIGHVGKHFMSLSGEHP